MPKNISLVHARSALLGLPFILPFLALNWIIGSRIEPFYSLIRPDSSSRALEFVILAIYLLILPVGAWVAARPMFQMGSDGKHTVYILNALIAGLMLLGFSLLVVAIAAEVYRCEILRIPNCD